MSAQDENVEADQQEEIPGEARQEEIPVPDEDVENATDKISKKDIEKLEEEKLKALFPNAGRPVGGHSAFLQKRLANRQKYFDSGDYQIAKHKNPHKSKYDLAGKLPSHATGDCIPTPETVPVRKTSIIQSSKFTPNQ